jgi:hypothetical protein
MSEYVWCESASCTDPFYLAEHGIPDETPKLKAQDNLRNRMIGKHYLTTVT